MKTFLLIGFRGVGKTTIGEALAAKLQAKFQDSDQELALELNEDLASFAKDMGEAEFRRRERTTIDRLLRESESSATDTVIALGGGFVDFDSSLARLRGYLSVNAENATVVWIKSPLEKVLERLRADTATRRVRAKDNLEDLDELYRFREPEYRKLAHKIFDNDFATVDEAVTELGKNLA